VFSLRLDEGKSENFPSLFFLLHVSHGWEKEWVFIVPFLLNSILSPSFFLFLILALFFCIITKFWIIINLFFFCILYSRALHSPLLIKISSLKLNCIPDSRNRWGYFSLISNSLSYVSFSICEFLHNTLTSGTLLFLNVFSLRSMILIGLVLSVKSFFTSIGTGGNTHEGSTSVD
jgi:hypothetical protein